MTEEVKSTDPYDIPIPVQKVELADGTTLKGHAALNSVTDDLWISLDSETSMAEAFNIFSDANKTKVIICYISNSETLEWFGYTNMNLIQQNKDKTISIRMQKKDV